MSSFLDGFYEQVKTTPLPTLVSQISNCHDEFVEQILNLTESSKSIHRVDENSLLLACFLACLYKRGVKVYKKRFGALRDILPHNTTLVCKYINEMISSDVLLYRLDNLPTLLLSWPIDSLDANHMTLLNYAVSERHEDAFMQLLDYGASADVAGSVYSNMATLAMFHLQMPTPQIKRMSKKLITPYQLKQYDKFFNVCDALLTNNLLHIHSTLNGVKKLDTNLRTASNTSLLGYVNHVEILLRLINMGFVIHTKDIARVVNYIDGEVSLYIVRYCDVDGYEVAKQCQDALLRYRLVNARKEREEAVVNTLDAHTTIAKDVCKLIGSLV
jgi:hypothetical protein